MQTVLISGRDETDYNSHQQTGYWKSLLDCLLPFWSCSLAAKQAQAPAFTDTTLFSLQSSTLATKWHSSLSVKQSLVVNRGSLLIQPLSIITWALLGVLPHPHFANKTIHPTKAILSLVGVLLFPPYLSQATNTALNCIKMITLWGRSLSLSHLCISSKSIWHEALHTVNNSTHIRGKSKPRKRC